MITQIQREAQKPETASPLQGRLVVVTGGSRGIGRELASLLASEGAAVLVGSRQPADGEMEHRVLDLASFASVREFAARLVREGRPIDMLVLNAGVHVPWKELTTADGQELHWQVNYLSNFLLVHLLLDLCRRSTLKRIVYVASQAHRLASLPGAKLLGFWYRYARSKQAAIAFFMRLQELHPHLTIRVVSPGYVDTEIHRHKGVIAARVERAFARPRTPAQAAREILNVCARPCTGASVYWDRGSAHLPHRRCLVPEFAETVWRAALQSVGSALPDVRPHEWISNYARTFGAFGPAVERPTSLEELAEVVRSAAAQSRSVRMVGGRHSYNDSFYSRTCMISLEHFDRVLRLEPERGTVTCEGGVSIEALAIFLDEQGYALRYCGNHGKQTLAGALATGTHGYGREGGVMSELVRAVTLLLPDGRLLHTSEERDLRALRLGLGTLGVVVEVTLDVERAGPCRHEVACIPRHEFRASLEQLARANEHLRFLPHPFDESSVLYATINRGSDAPTQPVQYLGSSADGAARLLVPWLRIPQVRRSLGRVLAANRYRSVVHVPFSTMLFVQSGVADRRVRLARAGRLALNRPDWLNMELAVPLARFADFEHLFAEQRPRASGPLRTQPYFTCRVAGAARSVLLAPNFDRDVVFVDIHADPREPSSSSFLRRLEAEAATSLSARPHWGKVFFAESRALRDLYPAENISEFIRAKQRFDPEGVFSSDYTRRVLGV